MEKVGDNAAGCWRRERRPFSRRSGSVAAAWAIEEMEGIALNDQRLNRRAIEVLSDLGERPTASIPAASGGRKEMEATYRLFKNRKAAYQKLLRPHAAKTRQRVRQQKVVLC